MNILLISLFVVSTSTRMSATPVVGYLGESSCTAAGLTCESCEVSLMCVKIGDYYFETNKQTCPDGYSCFAGTCTNEVNPACDYEDLSFPCQYQGVYPHPGDWTKYVFCNREENGSLVAYPQDCEEGAGYNPLTTYCSKNLDNIDPTTFPVDRCLSQTQVPEPLPANPTIYYYCAAHPDNGKIYPFLTACPKGGIYENGECVINLEIKHKE